LPIPFVPLLFLILTRCSAISYQLSSLLYFHVFLSFSPSKLLRLFQYSNTNSRQFCARKLQPQEGPAFWTIPFNTVGLQTAILLPHPRGRNGRRIETDVGRITGQHNTMWIEPRTLTFWLQQCHRDCHCKVSISVPKGFNSFDRPPICFHISQHY
jgi:hypothetical protein